MPEPSINGSDIPVPPSLGDGNTQYFYGRVNFWATMSKPGTRSRSEVLNVVRKRLLDDITYCTKYGVTGYIIEMGGWRTCSELIRNKKDTKKYVKKVKIGKNTYKRIVLPSPAERYRQYLEDLQIVYHYLHGLCVKNGMWLMVCLVNINALESKLGNKAIPPELLFDYGKDLMKIVKNDGHQNILIQPISEYRYCYDRDVAENGENADMYKYLPKCYSSAFKQAYRFHRFVCDEANEMGVKTILNEAPGGPATCNNCDFAAYHPNKYTEGPWEWTGRVRMNKCFVVSDTSPMIKWLNNGASVTKTNANCKASRIKLWKNKFGDTGIAVLGYYDFKREKNNQAAIKAMGS